MLERKAAADKILLLGVDGLDPRLTRKYVDMGIMPNVAEYIKRGACREDLVLLGGNPTITPPMWTTLATGCNSYVHGITDFYRCGDDIDLVDYNLDSRLCKAEQLWNCFAEAGKKTLVWHWPGSSWPPTSDSENLLVVDGTSPGSVGMATSQIESESILGASVDMKEVRFIPKAPMEASAACVITDLDVDDSNGGGVDILASVGAKGMKGTRLLVERFNQCSSSTTEAYVDMSQSPIKIAEGWTNAPADAKEFYVVLSGGLIRRPALILKNENGIYDKIAIYKNKKNEEPIATIALGEMVAEIIDEAYKNDKMYKVNRNMKLLKLDPKGNSLTMYISGAMDMENDSCYSPKRLFREIADNVGYPPPTSMLGRQDSMLITECMLANWYVTAEWQAKAIHHMIESEDVDVVFSHYHAVDLEEHQFIKHLADIPENRNDVSVAEKWMEDLYIQTDWYLGQFLHYLDEGWTICIFSDHAQVAPKNEYIVFMEGGGCTIPWMEEMGFTYVNRDEKGNAVSIDWTKTTAVMNRFGHVYLNLKGRNKHTLEDGTTIDGIVDPADKWEMEEKIMTKLYEAKSEKTGNRIVAVALRNKDAILLGNGGPEAGDIICWMTEGHNFDHGDSLSTTLGENDTSVSPIFIGAGKGFKQGFYTDRYIRQIDFAPTVAVLGGVRMPAQCEGAPMYQILENEY